MSGSIRPQLAAAAVAALGIGASAAVAGALLGSEALGLALAPHTPASPEEVAAIFANNARVALVAAAGAACWSLQLPRLTLRCCDLALALLLALNAAAIGAALGALGGAALQRSLAHAPLELAGFALVAVAYLRSRRGAGPLELVRLFGSALALLAIAAAAESLISGEIG